MWKDYRGDVKRLQWGMAGGNPDRLGFVQRVVTKGMGELVGPVYSFVDYLGGNQDTVGEKPSHYDEKIYPLANSFKTKGFRQKHREFKMRRRGGLVFRKKKGPPRKKKMAGALMSKPTGARGSRAQQNRGPLVSYSKVVTNGPLTRGRIVSARRGRGRRGAVKRTGTSKVLWNLNGKLFGGTIENAITAFNGIQEYVGFNALSATYDLGTYSLGYGFVPAATDPPPTYRVGTADTVVMGKYADTCFPVSPNLGRYASTLWTQQSSIYRRYCFKKLIMIYRPHVPTTDPRSITVAYTPDPTTIDLGHQINPQLTWDDNLIKNMNPSITAPAYTPWSLDVTSHLPRKWFYIRNQHSYPCTPGTWQTTDTTVGDTVVYNNVAANVVVASSVSGPTGAVVTERTINNGTNYYSGSWDSADVRQSIQGIFIMKIDGYTNGLAPVLGDFFFSYSLMFSDLNSKIGSNLGTQYISYAPASTGLISTSTALTSTSVTTRIFVPVKKEEKKERKELKESPDLHEEVGDLLDELTLKTEKPESCVSDDEFEDEDERTLMYKTKRFGVMRASERFMTGKDDSDNDCAWLGAKPHRTKEYVAYKREYPHTQYPSLPGEL